MNTKFFLFIISALFLGVPFVSHAVTVGPVKLEYSADPGKIIEGIFFLQNEGVTATTFYPSFERFTEDNSGQKNFTKEESNLSTWFHMATSVALSAGEAKQIPFTIEVPQNAPPGGHFAVIWWRAGSSGEGGQVAIVTRAGILVYLTVSGEMSESGGIKEFYASDRLVTSLPITFTTVFENNGNSYLKPKGTLIFKNLFGGVAFEAKVNEFGSNILPRTTKTFNTTIDLPGFFFGPYRAVLSLSYGAGDASEVTKELWILIAPWKAVITFVILLLVIFVGIPLGIKKYNRWIITKAQRMQ